jgi:hypothetical protein
LLRGGIRQLRRAGSELPLQPKTFDLLGYLLENRKGLHPQPAMIFEDDGYWSLLTFNGGC